MVRSIDGNSVEFCNERMGALDLIDRLVVDTSLYRAYVRLIRKAENFIYIESQVSALHVKLSGFSTKKKICSKFLQYFIFLSLEIVRYTSISAIVCV